MINSRLFLLFSIFLILRRESVIWVATLGVTGYRSASSAGVIRFLIRVVRSSLVLFIISFRNLLFLR